MQLKRINSESELPKYVVVFGMHNQFWNDKFKGLHEHAAKVEPLEYDAVKVTLKPTAWISFDDFARKGSVSVFGHFIHDDYRCWYEEEDDLQVFLVESECECTSCETFPHKSDCAVHNAPALPVGACSCN